MARLSLIARVALAPIAALSAAAAVFADADAQISFNRDVKPLLARRCFGCHGPSMQEAGLRLNDPAVTFAELESGVRAVVPGDVEQSEIVAERWRL